MRSKLRKFKENVDNPRVIQPGKEQYEKIKGRWREDFFQNDHPIVLELACGRGEYTVGLGKNHPHKNYIGVDIKGDRIHKGAMDAEALGMNNFGFLRTHILHLENFFEAGEIDEIWIIFPDPRPKDRDEKRRLTHPRYLELYKRLLKPGSIVHLKTDSTQLFQFTLDVLADYPGIKNLEFTWDLYHSDYLAEHFGIRTKYEHIFSSEGHDIKYLKFQIFPD